MFTILPIAYIAGPVDRSGCLVGSHQAMLPLQNLYYRFWSGNNDIGFLTVLGGVVNVAAPNFIL